MAGVGCCMSSLGAGCAVWGSGLQQHMTSRDKILLFSDILRHPAHFQAKLANSPSPCETGGCEAALHRDPLQIFGKLKISGVAPGLSEATSVINSCLSALMAGRGDGFCGEGA